MNFSDCSSFILSFFLLQVLILRRFFLSRSRAKAETITSAPNFGKRCVSSLTSMTIKLAVRESLPLSVHRSFLSRFLIDDVIVRYEVLLIADEVQAGFGLTGKFWAHQHYGTRHHCVIIRHADVIVMKALPPTLCASGRSRRCAASWQLLA